MPLPPSVAREALHLRAIELHGYRRVDGLYDVEARMTDTKTEVLCVDSDRSIPPGEPIHDMWVRLVVDADLTVVDIVASTDAAPWGACVDGAQTLQALVGQRLGPGWTKVIRERIGGRHGCTHLRELLQPLATVAFQTLFEVRRHQPQPVDAAGKPRKIDSCLAYAGDGDLVRRTWPEFAEASGTPADSLACRNK
ncbi:DUF2889 domain-containing protein [Cupriavidus alkaliphilus]|uniref:DUF2889 domain-containing protein n=1 Tax=Cupriavidus alkaliphilus TaxID=942866 RepID=UPI00161A5412|nr:DUF2889 domain-containing protein [Cupriavidus alkaliphilus]MBB3014075.1 hypothetical protein [Cupriavidus alkaliphilus]